MIRMVPIKSSAITNIGHDPQRNELHVKFRSGSTLAFAGVSADKHQALLSAPSAGKYFADNIRDYHASRRV